MRNLLTELVAIARDAESVRELLGALWVLVKERPLDAQRDSTHRGAVV